MCFIIFVPYLPSSSVFVTNTLFQFYRTTVTTRPQHNSLGAELTVLRPRFGRFLCQYSNIQSVTERCGHSASASADTVRVRVRVRVPHTKTGTNVYINMCLET
jgi:hypothetical protein